MHEGARRDRRYRVRVPAIVMRGKEEALLWTEDVSYRGVFLGTATPIASRSLLRVRMMLAPDAAEIALHAMVVHVSDAARGRVPGVGLQFYAMDARVRARWDEFIAYARTYHPEATGQPPLARPSGGFRAAPVSDPPAAAGPPSRPPGPRRDPAPGSLDVEPPSSVRGRLERALQASLDHPPPPTRWLEVMADDALRPALLGARDGSLFVRTDVALEVGESIMLSVLDARHRAEGTFPLAAVVSRRVDERGMKGVGVTLLGLDDLLRDELSRFLDQGVLAPDSGIFIDEDDPRFA